MKCIYFWCSDMTIEANFAFDIKVLQAINKQVEELGWLNVYNDMCEYDNDKPILNDEY